MFSFFFVATFAEKLRRLMRDRGETTRSLGAAVGATSGAVSGWVYGAKPRPTVAKQIAAHFGVTVEQLLDETQDLPGGELSAAEQFLAEAPGAVAAARALEEKGNTEAGQHTFEEYLQHLRALREEVERYSPGDKAAAAEKFERAIAAWLASAGIRPKPNTKSKTDDVLEAGARKLEELKRKAAQPADPAPAGRQHRKA